jgi:aspartate/methionine/tyrosine aminotransferase
MRCLTEYQFPNLSTIYNLSDAHSRQSYKNGLEKIIENLSQLFKKSEVESYQYLLDNCVDVFLCANNQLCYKDYRYIVSHTASQSMEIVANYLRLNSLNVFLIEPTFDNIPDILKRHCISISPISEINIKSFKIPAINIDSLFLTLPNNPTGFIVTKKEFKAIVEHCYKYDILLIIDACFRLFDNRMMYDWYEIISRYKIRFIIIEDTGKIWPTQDLKASFILSDNETIKQLTRISRDFLLNVSPFKLKLIGEVVPLSKKNGFSDFRNLLKKNRAFLRNIIKNTGYFRIYNMKSLVSVELIKINFSINSTILVDYLYSNGIGVLPCVPFFWSDRAAGEGYLRIALARDEKYFRAGICRLFELIKIYTNGK